jgi:REP element-mobilizing transposase RayT
MPLGRSRQLELGFRTWGGARPGAGRPRAGEHRIPHARRPTHAARHPLHVTLRVARGVESLRSRRTFRAIVQSFMQSSARSVAAPEFRLCHYSVQSNHVHLIVEAANSQALSRGMQSLGIRLARRVNRAQGRTGAFLADRYHARSLRTPLEVRNALRYVLANGRRHAVRSAARWAHGIDPFSSALWFDGFRGAPARTPPAYVLLARAEWAPLGASDPRAGPRGAPEVTEPRTFLLRTGWRRHGLIATGDAPRAAAR